MAQIREKRNVALQRHKRNVELKKRKKGKGFDEAYDEYGNVC